MRLLERLLPSLPFLEYIGMWDMAIGSSFYSEQAITYLKSAHTVQRIVTFGCNWSKEKVKKTGRNFVNQIKKNCF